MPGREIELENDLQSLHFYSVENGDSLLVRWWPKRNQFLQQFMSETSLYNLPYKDDVWGGREETVPRLYINNKGFDCNDFLIFIY